MNWREAKAVLEALIFASSEPVTVKEMSMITVLNEETIASLLADLAQE